jgi:hypothetical protein
MSHRGRRCGTLWLLGQEVANGEGWVEDEQGSHVELLEALAWPEEVRRSSAKVGHIEEDGSEDNGLSPTVWPSARLTVGVNRTGCRGRGFDWLGRKLEGMVAAGDGELSASSKSEQSGRWHARGGGESEEVLLPCGQSAGINSRATHRCTWGSGHRRQPVQQPSMP